jgi:hypothetical protein
MAESDELKEIRRLLSRFEAKSEKPEGLNALSEALEMVFDLLERSTIDSERRIVENLLDSYSKKVDARVTTLLSNQSPVDLLRHWNTVMQEISAYYNRLRTYAR